MVGYKSRYARSVVSVHGKRMRTPVRDFLVAFMVYLPVPCYLNGVTRVCHVTAQCAM